MAVSKILIGVGGAAGLLFTLCHAQPATRPAENAVVRAHCMFVPQRLDDFAWENDRVAFRAYGPALEKQDGPQSGIDIWVKRVPRLVQENWYKTGDYHNDNGDGLDGYKVGSSRGCGGTAIVHDGKLVASGNYTAHRVIWDGPASVCFELDYGPWKVGNTTVKETKRIALHAGSQFSLVSSTFTFDGPPLTVAIGLKLHEKGTSLEVGESSIATWEPLDGENNGSLGCAVMLGRGQGKSATIDGNVCLTTEVKSGETIHYSVGGNWSKVDYATPELWQTRVRELAKTLIDDSFIIFAP